MRVPPEATLIAGELFKNIDGRFRPGEEWSLEVRDESRNLFTASASALRNFEARR
jgi:hypothetical protein